MEELKCAYTGVPDECHRGKREFHHPISKAPMVGLTLCESHHSLARLKGWRKTRYPREMIVNKTLEEMRNEITELIHAVVIKAGYKISDIDKS